MPKFPRLIWFRCLNFKFIKQIRSVTLMELLVTLIVGIIMVLSFYSFQTFGHKQVTGADRRAKVQNELSFALEHMSKSIQKARGNFNNRAISYLPSGSTGGTGTTGFRVYLDLNNPQTPAIFTDDGYIDYTLSGNALMSYCTPNTGICPPDAGSTGYGGAQIGEILTNKLLAGVVGATLLPTNPTSGFYIMIGAASDTVEIGLVGRYYPTVAKVTGGAKVVDSNLTNPQVELKTKLICNSSSTH